MPPRKPQPDTRQPRPPYWIADVPLPVGTEMGGEAMPARAFNPGDHVPPEHVERFGWQPYVHAPEGDWTPPEPASSESGIAGSGE